MLIDCDSKPAIEQNSERGVHSIIVDLKKAAKQTIKFWCSLSLAHLLITYRFQFIDHVLIKRFQLYNAKHRYHFLVLSGRRRIRSGNSESYLTCIYFGIINYYSQILSFCDLENQKVLLWRFSGESKLHGITHRRPSPQNPHLLGSNDSTYCDLLPLK